MGLVDPGRRIFNRGVQSAMARAIDREKPTNMCHARCVREPASVLGGRARVARAGGRTSATLSAFVLALGVAA
tara:strand:+ start:104 stop:322 length:219 start_codon:yes stop_codon:yes gene_type:complete